MNLDKFKKVAKNVLILGGIPFIAFLIYYGYNSYKSESNLRQIKGEKRGCSQVLTDIAVKVNGATFEETASKILATQYKVQGIILVPVYRANLSINGQNNFLAEVAKRDYISQTPIFQTDPKTGLDYIFFVFTKFDQSILDDWLALTSKYYMKEDNGDAIYLMKVTAIESDMAFQTFQLIDGVEFVEYNTSGCE